MITMIDLVTNETKVASWNKVGTELTHGTDDGGWDGTWFVCIGFCMVHYILYTLIST